MDIKITVDAKLTLKQLERLQKTIQPRQMLQAIGLRQIKWIADNFKAEGLETKWPPLSPSTVYGRRKGSSRILQDTGRLRMSFVRGNPLRLTERMVEVGTNLQYAAFHEYGTRPYTIEPVNAKMLAFPHPNGPAILNRPKVPHHRGLHGFFVKVVHHPGLPKRPMLPTQRTAAQLARDVIAAVLARATGGKP